MKRCIALKTGSLLYKPPANRRFCNEIQSYEVNLTDISKTYDSAKFEPAIIERWKKRESKKKDSSRKNPKGTFRMILPPPNLTGKLHVGHALTVGIEDTIARWSTMNGFNVEWIPGFDHAGIATQSVVMRKLKNGLFSTKSLDPKTLQFELESFANFNSTVIAQQLESMGGLLDWDSSYYTLDRNHSEVVKEAFMNLFYSGVITRGDGIVNWSCALGSSVSDIEVNQAEFQGKTSFRVPGYEKLLDFGVLFCVEYSLDQSDEKVTVATSRPETIFGDVALAVNPEDNRYTSLVGRNVKNPLTGHLMPIIADSRVKPNFGSGVLKVTPAHDKTDFLIGATHNLKKIDVIDKDGNLNDLCGEFTGLPRFTARQKIIDFLLEKKIIIEIKDYSGSIGLCSRTADIIEPRILPHWFFRTKALTRRFLDLIETKKLIVAPDNYLQSLKRQLRVVDDWCLSRQIRWGHRIPAYYHSSAPEKWVIASDVNNAKKELETQFGIVAELSDIVQDGDVLDTWFSSALIPLSISGWPYLTELKEISLMETGWDILLFWVWRMVIMTLALTDKVPFRKVLLHGIVTDHYGRKMSKSRGNVIDPMDIVNGISFQNMKSNALNSFETGELDQNEYNLRISSLEKNYPRGFPVCGSDALRFTLLSQDICNQDLKLSLEHLSSSRNFTNKMWQAMRFYLRYADEGINHPVEIAKPSNVILKSLADHWILSCLHAYSSATFQYLNQGNFHLYAEATRKFFHQQLCDVYIELIKNDMKSGINVEQHVMVMRYIIANGLKLAHPILPFVTEQIWSHVTYNKLGLLIDQQITTPSELVEFSNSELEGLISKVMKIVGEIRSVKSKLNSKELLTYHIEIPSASVVQKLERHKSYIETLAGGLVTFEAPSKSIKHKFVVYTFVLDDKTCRVSTVKTADLLKSTQANEAKIAKLKLKLDKLKLQFDNPSFQQNAPPDVIEKLRKKVEILQLKLDETNGHSSKFS